MTRKNGRSGEGCTCEPKEVCIVTLGVARTQESLLHGANRYITMYLASLDVKTNFNVAKLGMHGRIITALLEEMKDLKGKESFEAWKTEFRYSQHVSV